LITNFGKPITYEQYKKMSVDDLRDMVKLKISELIL